MPGDEPRFESRSTRDDARRIAWRIARLPVPGRLLPAIAMLLACGPAGCLQVPAYRLPKGYSSTYHRAVREASQKLIVGEPPAGQVPFPTIADPQPQPDVFLGPPGGAPFP